ncbi:nuclear pore complex protein DDB_G0274915-like [Orussus abietinus]|uniref:nuclear pore complex protein DDB_G0274915-like n=1 Tax=Orussus abietinus TaxID=222816 RepID=UPI0006256E18|nr:nuclear pore complex protein DDB_G0274915-like [Orussus abietinus]
MVLCRYFQQGNCRFGQYCRFDHINNFANGNQAPRNKIYVDNKNAAFMVAHEVFAAEQGGQWLLSCFGPFKEQPCIAGIEDLSPEEVRWEMYQAQKNGTVEQTKLQFQQLCHEMKTKRDALKQPTAEIVSMLEQLQKGTQSNNGFGANVNTPAKSNFFSTPQLGMPTSNTSSSNVFRSKVFGSMANPFSGGFNSTPAASPFGRPVGTNTNSAFGAKPAFGSAPVFGTTTNSLFGANKSSTVFGSAQNTQAFGSTTPQSNTVFGAAPTQSVFGQSTAFGVSNQSNSPFSRPQTAQPTGSIFGGGATPTTNSLFGGAVAPQSSPALFGATSGTQGTMFSTTATSPQVAAPIFGSVTTSVTSAPIGAPSMFGQPKATAAFGGAPVFGGTANFGSKPGGAVFGGQPTFGGSPIATGNIFGGSTANTAAFGTTAAAPAFGTSAAAPAFGSGSVTPSFGSVVQTNNTPFGANPVTTSSIFAGSQGSFGAGTTTAVTSPFGATTTTTTPSFSASSGPFGQTTMAPSPFSRSTPFGTTSAAFGTTTPSSGMPFGSSQTPSVFGTAANNSSFGSSIFGGAQSTPFSNTSTTVTTTTTSNPFAPKPQQNTAVFGTQNTFVSSATNSPFSKSPFSSATSFVERLDDTVYSIEGLLTDDEKNMYLSEQFVFGKIPTKPPTKELR